MTVAGRLGVGSGGRDVSRLPCGLVNATAPNPVTNKEFSKSLGRALGRPSFMPTPKLMLRLVLGKVARVVTTGQRVLPRKALALGYPFKFPNVEEALADALR